MLKVGGASRLEMTVAKANPYWRQEKGRPERGKIWSIPGWFQNRPFALR